MEAAVPILHPLLRKTSCGARCGRGTTVPLPSPRSSHRGALGEHLSEAPHAPQPLSGYTWCFNKCFLFDFLIFVFSEKALASSNSFLRVAGGKEQGEGLTQKPFPKLPRAVGRRGAGPGV